MKFEQTGLIAELPKLLSATALSVVLTACGGGTSGDTTGGGLVGDTNGDGVLDLSEGDFNDDGVISDADFDFNLDGFTNIEDDANKDGVVDAKDFDIDKSGFADFLDDINADGKIDKLDVATVDLGVCKQGLGGTDTDPDSSNDAWGDNCVVSSTGPHKNSSYARGIQRILFCTGNADGATSVTQFADGAFGPKTKTAVEKFQTAGFGLTVDGIVGSKTWAALRDTLVRVNTVTDTGTNIVYDGFAVTGSLCDGTVQFWREMNSDLSAGVGWTLAESPGSNNRIPFSIDP